MKILLTDLDGTIRCSTTGNFIESYKGQKPMLGADKAIEHFAACGWHIVGISNQGGIASGYKTLEATIKEMEYTLWLFPKLQEIFFCPDFEGQDCIIVNRDGIIKYSATEKEGYKSTGKPKEGINFRKPGHGMLAAAIEKTSGMRHQIFLDATIFDPDYECWMIGDRQEDEDAAAGLYINYLNAETWRKRFLPGMHEFKNVTPAQIKFLEGIR